MGWTHSLMWDTLGLVRAHPWQVLFFVLSFCAWGYLIRAAMTAKDKEDA